MHTVVEIRCYLLFVQLKTILKDTCLPLVTSNFRHLNLGIVLSFRLHEVKLLAALTLHDLDSFAA